MSDDIQVKTNYKERLVQTEKTDYKVPIFLLKQFDNMPSSRDFYMGYTAISEVPLWWTRGLALPLTKRESKKEIKKAVAQKRALEEQRIIIEQANARYLKELEKQEKEYEKRCGLLDKQAKLKTEEQQQLEFQNKLNYQNKLLELELQLQKLNKEKEFYESENKKLAELEQNGNALADGQNARENTLAAIDSDVEYQKEINELLKSEVYRHYKEKGKQPPQFSAEEKPSESGIVITETIEQKNYKLEKFNTENILEMKHLTLSYHTSGNVELSNISFDVKKQGITVVYSPSLRVLAAIFSSIMRTYSSELFISSGEIRIGGEINNDILRDEFRESIKNKIATAGDIADKIARLPKKLSFLQKDMKNSEKFISYLKLLGLNAKILSDRADKINEKDRFKIAVAASLAKELPLTILFEAEEELDGAGKIQFTELMNGYKDAGAVLILTSDIEIISSLKNIELYTINN